MADDKWNKIIAELSDDDQPDRSPDISGSINSLNQSDLITIPWDSFCEMARWALDKHGLPYIEYSYPWGIHVMRTVQYSDEKERTPTVNIPILENGKKEVYKRSISDVLMYMFAQSFSARLRIYSPGISLTLQEFFDDVLAPASRKIFLHCVTTSGRLEDRYLINTVHLNTWKGASRLLWPFMRYFLLRTNGMTGKLNRDRTMEKAWRDVDLCFSVVENILAGNQEIIPALDKKDGNSREESLSSFLKSEPPKLTYSMMNSKYLTGTTFTAGDLSFASHAALVLLPNHDDLFSEFMTLQLPRLKELPDGLSRKIRELRERGAGQYAIRMYRKERKPVKVGLRSQPSKFSKLNNPWWSDYKQLRSVVSSSLLTVLSVVGGFFAVIFNYFTVATAFAIFVVLGLVISGLAYLYFSGETGKKQKKIALEIVRGLMALSERSV
ncbi:hypothetical protein BJ742DRAFT_896999 [Cladochytrium replicatum]|nr:hypothetical protein BJ742DRAFT_896999 [Cladochytrium replicatum]